MTRRRLWTLTGLVCMTLILPSTASMILDGSVLGNAAPHQAADLAAKVGSAAVSTAGSGWRVATQASGAAISSASRFTAHNFMVAVNYVRIETRSAWTWYSEQPPMSKLALGVIAVAALLAITTMTLATILRRRSLSGRLAPRPMRRLARRGRSIALIARRTGVSQDAVRQILRPANAGDDIRFAHALSTSLEPSANWRS